MRAAVLICAISVMAACESEPTFDERYEEAQEQINEKADELDKELEADPE